MRVGLGYDSHRFDPERPLILGGVEIPDHDGLAGHSDGDAVVHAVIDALLGAAGLGSIGELFPDTDPRWEGADSIRLLREAMEEVQGENFQVVNVAVTVVAQQPEIAPHRQAMAERLADELRVRPDQVNLQGKSNESMGWIGRGEGLAVMAVALLDRITGTDRTVAAARAGG